MTKQNKITIKLAILSSVGVALVFLLGNNAMTNANPFLAYGSQLGAVVLGVFTTIGVIATLVYFLTEEEAN
jgi:hypothetical protein